MSIIVQRGQQLGLFGCENTFHDLRRAALRRVRILAEAYTVCVTPSVVRGDPYYCSIQAAFQLNPYRLEAADRRFLAILPITMYSRWFYISKRADWQKLSKGRDRAAATRAKCLRQVLKDNLAGKFSERQKGQSVIAPSNDPREIAKTRRWTSWPEPK